MKVNARLFFVLTALLALLALMGSAAALSVQPDKSVYFIGQEMGVSGTCTSGQTVEVTALSDRAKAFTQTLPCDSEGKYSFFQTLSFQMPSGPWTLKALEGETVAEQEVEVKPTADSSHYLITFVSPAPVKHYKAEKLIISVKVSDSGEPVSGATVVFYDVSGNLNTLEESGAGVYSAEYTIPFNAPGGNWRLQAFAERTTDKPYGGSNTLVVGVDRAALQLEILAPSLQNFDLESEIPFKVKATYVDGKGLEDGATAWVEFNGTKIDLQKVSGAESTFAGSFKTKEENIGSLTFNLIVRDAAENEGRKSIDVVVTVDRTALFIKNNWFFIVAGLAIIGVVAYGSYSKVRGQLDRKSLLAERVKLREAIRKIQSDYFDRMIIDKNTFRKRLGEAEARLLEIDKILKSQGGENA